MKRIRIAFLAVALVALVGVLVGCNNIAFEFEKPTPKVTSPTISKDGVLVVGVNTENAPMAGKAGSSGKIVGIDVDIAAAIADDMGLTLEIVDIGVDDVGAVKNKKVDIVLGMDSANADAEIWKSTSYLNTGVALFGLDESAKAPEAGAVPKVGAQSASMSAWAVSNEYGADALVSQSDLSTAFTALKDGSVNYVAADAVIGSYAAHAVIPGSTIVAMMQKPTGYSIACLASNAELQKQLVSTYDKISRNGVLEVIKSKWLGTGYDISKIALTPKAAAANTPTPAQ